MGRDTEQGGSSDGSDDETGQDKAAASASGVYKPPMMSAAHYGMPHKIIVKCRHGFRF